jgi:hypothetical protein
MLDKVHPRRFIGKSSGEVKNGACRRMSVVDSTCFDLFSRDSGLRLGATWKFAIV